MAERVSIPGFLRGRRYRSIADPERFLMFYETVDESRALERGLPRGPERADAAHARGARLVPQVDAQRVHARRRRPAYRTAWPAPVLVTARFPEAATAGGDGTGAAARRSTRGAARRRPGGRVRRYRLVGDSRSGKSNESAIHGAGIGELDGLLLAESSEVGLLDEAEPQARMRQALADALGPAAPRRPRSRPGPRIRARQAGPVVAGGG